MNAFERRKLCCIHILFWFVVAGISLKHPKSFLSLFLNIAIIKVHSGSNSTCTMPCQCSKYIIFYPNDSSILGLVFTLVQFILTRSSSHTSSIQLPYSSIPPAKIAIPFLLIILKEWSFLGHGLSSFVRIIYHFLNLMSKFWDTFPSTLMNIISLLRLPF